MVVVGFRFASTHPTLATLAKSQSINTLGAFLILNKITQIKGFTGFVPSDNQVNLLIRVNFVQSV